MEKPKRSRIIRITSAVVIILVAIWLISTGIIFYLTSQAVSHDMEEAQIELIKYVADILKVDIVGAITTVVSLCIARYGLRETAANLTGKKQSEITGEK